MKTLIIIIISVLFSFNSWGQSVRIENITIDAETAQKYFLDCYMRPDTVKLKMMWESKVKFNGAFAYSMEEERYERQMVESYNQKVLSLAIREVFDTVYHPAHKDTIYNYQITMWSSNDTKDIIKARKEKQVNSGIKEILEVPARTHIFSTSKYLVPRNPSVTDFIKWQYSNLKQP